MAVNHMEKVLDKILLRLDDKIKSAGLHPKDITPDADLVKSGLLDSITFVDLVLQLEKDFNVEVDFEAAFVNSEFTTLYGLAGHIAEKIK